MVRVLVTDAHSTTAAWGPGFLVNPEGRLLTNSYVIQRAAFGIIKMADDTMLPLNSYCFCCCGGGSPIAAQMSTGCGGVDDSRRPGTDVDLVGGITLITVREIADPVPPVRLVTWTRALVPGHVLP
jgi:hypothetical protein